MLGRLILSSNVVLRSTLVKVTKVTVKNVFNAKIFDKQSCHNFSSLMTGNVTPPKLLSNSTILNIGNNISPIRTVTKYSFRKGRRKSVKAVLRRFYRLSWGAWIRTKCGRNKRLWRKSPPRKRRLRQHVFCNATQNMLLDKMVGSYWRKPKYYVDDPYEPYHVRDEFNLASTKPRPYFPPENQTNE